MLLALALLAPLLPTVATEAVGTQGTVPFIVGFPVVPRDLDAGDRWEEGLVDDVNRVLHYARVLTDDPERFEARAQDRSDVRYVHQDRLEDWIAFIPDDPRWSDQYGLRRINAADAWDTTIGSPEVIVCVADTGVRYTHQDLAGQRWLGGRDFVNGDSDPWDDQGHGTFTTAIAAATTNDGTGMAGTAQVGFLHAKVLNSAGEGRHSEIADGIQWCADRGADVINLSLGGPGSQVLHDALFYAKDAGALVVAAAGNDGPCTDCVSYPAAYGQAIAVPCTNQDNGQCSFSSQGPQTELAGPGKDILSAYHTGDGAYATGSGTSASSPFVAGVAALVWSKNPDLGRTEVRQILRDTAKDLGSSGRDNRFGYGLVDAKAALAATPALEPPGPLEDALNETFDGTLDPSWTFSGLWHVDDACKTPPSQPNYLGYHAQDACSYNQGLDRTQGSAIVTIDLTEAHWARLTLQHAWETESVDTAVEEMEIDLRPQGQTDWIPVQRWDAREPNQLAWTGFEALLATYAGETIDLRFRFDTVDGLSNDHPGWFIDDVLVEQVTNLAPVADAGEDVTTSDHDADGTVTVHLDGTGSRDPDGTLASHTWSLGGQILATTAQADVDLAVGTHVVNLTVEDDGGATATDPVTVTVGPNQAPVAQTGPDRLVRDDDDDGEHPVTLDATASWDPDGTLTSYTWTEDGTQIATGSQPQVTLARGEHTITLEITDDGGDVATDTVVIEVVENVPPIADAGPDLQAGDADGDGTQTVTLDGTASSDPDGTLTSYTWTEGGTQIATGAQPQVTLAEGTHTIGLTVADNSAATDTDTVNVTIQPNQPPVADAGPDRVVSDAGDDGSEPVTLDGTGSRDPDGGSLNLTWLEDGTVVAHGATPQLDLALGNHTLTLQATDLGGLTDDDTVLIEVAENLAPTAVASPSSQEARDSDGDDQEPLSFDGTGSSDEDGQITNWTWSIDDQVLGYGATPTLDVPTGSHTVTLTVTDDTEGQATDAVEAIVYPNQPPVADAGPDQTANDPDASGDAVVRLDAGGSRDPDGWITGYRWSTSEGILGTGSLLDVTLPVGRTAVTVEVTDSGGAVDTDHLVVEVLPNQLPEARFTVDCDQLTCTFDASVATDDDGQITSYRWDLGDGTHLQGQVVEHSYRMAGDYQIGLRVEDDGGAIHETELPLELHPPLIFDDDLEDGLEGWTIKNPSGPQAWKLRVDRSSSGQASVGISGYGPDEEDTLVSPEIDLSGAQTATLELRSWMEGERYCLLACTIYDFGRIEVTADDGQTWRTLHDDHWRSSGQNDNPTWRYHRFSLAPEAGETIRLRFSFFSDELSHYEGWYIDDLRVHTQPIPVETDLPLMPDPAGDAESASTLDDPALDLLGVDVRNEASGELTFVLTVADLSAVRPTPTREGALSGSWGVTWTGPSGTDMVRFIGSDVATSCDWGTFDGSTFTRLGKAYCSVSPGRPGTLRLLLPSGAMEQRGYTGTEVLEDVRAVTHTHHGVPPLLPDAAVGVMRLHDATYPALHPLG